MCIAVCIALVKYHVCYFCSISYSSIQCDHVFPVSLQGMGHFAYNAYTMMMAEHGHKEDDWGKHEFKIITDYKQVRLLIKRSGLYSSKVLQYRYIKGLDDA